MAENTKEKRIKAELKRLQAKFELVDANQREVAAQLLQNAAFMGVTLQDLQEIINAQGVTDEYRNGANQYGTKASATLQSYNALIKNYTAVIKTLAALVPREQKETRKPWELEPKTPEELAAEEERQAAIEYGAQEAGLMLEWGRELDRRRAAGEPRIDFEEWKTAHSGK